MDVSVRVDDIDYAHRVITRFAGAVLVANRIGPK